MATSNLRAVKSEAGIEMREEIKRVATEMLIRYGYQGFRFQQVADQLNITRGNIHYHFGNKQDLVEECVIAYTTVTLESFKKVWIDRETTLQEKINRTMDLNRQRYLQYNPSGDTGNPWSLIARMRLDRDLLPELAREALHIFGCKLDDYMKEGITIAVARGELRKETPVEDLALQLVSIANSAGPITQDAGSFERLEQLYVGVGRIVQHAYGSRAEAGVGARRARGSR